MIDFIDLFWWYRQVTIKIGLNFPSGSLQDRYVPEKRILPQYLNIAI